MSEFRLDVIDDLARIDPARWDALVEADPDGNPFVRHAFLHALHASGSATPDTGWAPCFLTLWAGPELAAAVPLYAKAHSYGEYVFDWAWADAMQRAGEAYYPKWLIAVPFTPVPGSRVLARDPASRKAAVIALERWLSANPLSSVHVLFAPDDQAHVLTARHWMGRETIQFHWHNRGFSDFSAFLSTLKQDKRKKIRAERRKVEQAGIQLARRTGSQITPEDWAFFYRCYENTYLAHGNPPYLTANFFERLGSTMADHVLMVVATRAGQPVASALGIVDEVRGRLYGRYWGAIETIDCLHFECCYYQMIEFAIERCLQVFEGGAQGAHKLARGFDPVRTHSAHRITHAGLASAVERFLAREHLAIDANVDELNEHRAWRDHQASRLAGEWGERSASIHARVVGED